MEPQLAQTSHTRLAYTQSDFDRFAALSGDDNPIHVDQEFSARSRFGRPVAHGMLLYSAVSRALGELIPGGWQVYQELKFPAPTYAGEELEVLAEVTALAETGLAEVSSRITRPDGQASCEGFSRVKPADRPASPVQAPAAARDEEAQKDNQWKGLALGQSAAISRTFTPAGVQEYVALSGDRNPLYLEADFARRHGLSGTIVPGPLLGGLFSCLLGTRLPGPGTNWLKQRLFFPRPAYPGEEIRARVTVTRLRPARDLVNLTTECLNPAGEAVCQGEALVLVADLPA